MTSNLLDSDALSSELDHAHNVGGLSGNINIATPKQIVVDIEYVTATHNLEQHDYKFNGHTAQPSMVNIELSKVFNSFHQTLTTAVGFNHSSNLLGFNLPMQQWYILTTFAPYHHMTLSAQINDDTDYSGYDDALIQGHHTHGSGKHTCSGFIEFAVDF